MKNRKTALAASVLCLAGAALADTHVPARNLAAACASCHGTDGRSVGGIDPLAGMPRDQMIQKLKDFRSGAKPATVMHQLTAGYTERQLEMIADYYSAQSK